MSFVAALALAVGLFVVAPYAAHLLRRRRAEERPFPAAHLVPATPPQARRRSALEDRALFAVRVAAIIALAILGATPFINCSHLALHRESGASIAMAIVLDDSLSMRAELPGGASRFERAREAAEELVSGARTGDAIAIVLAGAPARVLLATTTDAAAANQALEAVTASDRGTDLDAALQLGRELVGAMPQTDKRIVILSDLTGGAPSDEPLAGTETIRLWTPLTELAPAGSDCGVLSADRRGRRVEVRVRCARAPVEGEGEAPPSPSAGRKVEIVSGDKTLASVDLAAALDVETISLELPEDASGELFAKLTGADLIAQDDVAPVTPRGRDISVAVVTDPALSKVETGGPPPVEQALAALSLGVVVRPLPSVPDGADDLEPFAALIVDDTPGFTPEVRRALNQWVEKGGVLLLAVGPRAAAAPLGSGFDPLVRGVIRWDDQAPEGIDEGDAAILGPAAESLRAFAPKGRALFDPAHTADADVAIRWSDGQPFLLERRLGRGAVWAFGAPMSVRQSDLVLRPAFLVLLEKVVAAAQASGGATRLETGESWTFDGYDDVKGQWVAGPNQDPAAVAPTHDGDRLVLTTDRIGLYRLELDGVNSVRAATVPEAEIALDPRKVIQAGDAESLGGVATQIDASPYAALLLMGLLFLELALRARARAAAPAQAPGRSDVG